MSGEYYCCKYSLSIAINYDTDTITNISQHSLKVQLRLKIIARKSFILYTVSKLSAPGSQNHCLSLSCIFLPHFSRNPYERLVSAYKDKVLGEGGRYIERGNPCPRQMLNMPPAPALTFKQFVTCIIRRSKKTTANLSHFESGSNLDMHWKPQTLLCSFCATDFNIIGHAEHMTQDTYMALQLLAMKNMTLLQCNKSTAGRLNYTSTEDWYRTLGRELLKEFHQLYYHDFTLLGYNMTLA